MKLKALINLSDIVFFIFLTLTFLLIIVGSGKTENFQFLISIRIISAIIAILLIYFNDIKKSKLLKLLRVFYPLIFTAYFYGETGYYNNIFFENLDLFFVNLEQNIFNFQPSILFSQKYNMLWFSELMNFSYFSFYLLVIGIPVLLYAKSNKFFDKYYFILIFSFYTYYLLFAIFPVVGPQFYFPLDLRILPDSGIFHKIMFFIQENGETPTGAFPSSHVGISLIFVYIVYKEYPKLLYIVMLFAVLICFSTVYMKAHYVLDVVGGFISVPILYFIAEKTYLKFHEKSIQVT
ncbi:MAG: phosphatase PAP2 family protein [Bacteroidales bacterium]|nr:phosphatase PAP2 family protein [Bacteroidales bacterium]MBN2755582.1 phosphatase PAP2 family protein [Bacteroidales bacterium]